MSLLKRRFFAFEALQCIVTYLRIIRYIYGAFSMLQNTHISWILKSAFGFLKKVENLSFSCRFVSFLTSKGAFLVEVHIYINHLALVICFVDSHLSGDIF